MGKLSKGWQIYLIVNYSAAFSLFIYLLLTAQGKAPSEVIFFGILIFTFEFFSLKIPALNLYALSFPFLLAAIVIFGPSLAALLALFATIDLNAIRRGTVWYLLGLRASQFIIPTAVGGIVYQLFGGTVGGFKLTQIAQLGPFLVTSFVVSLAFNVLTAQYLKLEGEKPDLMQAGGQQQLMNTVAGYAALALTALVVIQVYATSGLLGLVWVIIPLVVVHQIINRYLEGRLKYQSELESFVSAIEEKQAATKEHAQRVADVALRIADKMSLSDEQKKVLKEAALLHDIGMIAVARRIIGKPGRLTKEEFEQIRNHPALGVDILRKIRVSEQVDRIVQFHHERFDGTGYPEGLIGETIPLLSRILSVADSFDAMVSPRPYRPVISEKKAIQELKHFSAIQFDPAVVDALAATMVPKLDFEEEITLTLFEEGQLQIDQEL